MKGWSFILNKFSFMENTYLIFLFFLIFKTCFIEAISITLCNEDKSPKFNSEWKKLDTKLIVLHNSIYRNDINRRNWSLLLWVKSVGFHQGVDGIIWKVIRVGTFLGYQWCFVSWSKSCYMHHFVKNSARFTLFYMYFLVYSASVKINKNKDYVIKALYRPTWHLESTDLIWFPFWQMRKLRTWEGNYLTQSHEANQWFSWAWSPGFLSWVQGPCHGAGPFILR